MDIRVSGHQVETGEALQSHAQERLSAIVDKYFGQALSSTVTFNRAPAGAFRCDIVTHAMQGLVLKGAGIAQDAHLALDQAAEKIDKQLRRYMRRLKDKSGGATLDALPLADVPDNAEYRVFEGVAEEVEAPDSPLTIAETRVDIPEASVSDAVMMLDLRNTTALLFRNSRTGNLNMVYRREDGNIGWVEPRA
jgi:ribosomal subunit interface protein